ncbi:MAG: CDP-alcohol phosphatidyltransferase family protein [Rhizomicrobium sp.]
MLDRPLKALSRSTLAQGARTLVRTGVPADFVSVAACVVGLAAIPALARHAYLLALALILANRLIDALDGAVARQTRVTGRGAFLDMTLDLIVFAGIPFGFALGDPSRGLAAAFFIFAIAATGASSIFLSSKMRAPGETMFGFVGRIMEDTELTLAFAIACIVPGWFSVVAYVAGVLCFLTAGSRIAFAVARLEEP